MIKKILVPITSSTDYGASALKYAIDMAKIFRAEIKGVFIKDVRLLEGGYAYVTDIDEDRLPMRGHLAKKGQTIKDYFHEQCKKARVKATFTVREGLTSALICKASKNVDLVVMGKKGESGPWLSGFLGSATLRVIDNTNLPLLVVDEKYKPIKNVLLPYSGGVYASKSIDIAKAICKSRKTKLTVLTIMKQQKEANLLQDTAKKLFERTRALKPKFDAVTGDLDRTVINYTKKSDADLVIVGSSKRTMMNLFSSDHLAKSVLKKTSAPVLLIH